MRAFFTLLLRASLGLVLVGGVLFFQPGVARADQVCFCSLFTPVDSLPKDVDLNVFDDASKYDRQCLPDVSVSDCEVDGVKKFDTCKMVESPEACTAKITEFDSDLENAKQIVIRAKNGSLPAGESPSNGTQSQGLLAKILPDCVFDDTVEGECKDVNIFIKLAIDLANVLLSIIGGIALIAFLYGGFILILSEGNSEKIEKGKGAMVAALIGLAVVFGAYLLVNILSDALGVSSSFRLQ